MVELRKNITIPAILLITVYLMVLGNSIRNRHTHKLPNGLVIIHAHPFTDANGLPVKHSHTQNQILFYQLFTFDFFDSAPEVFLAENYSYIRIEIISFYADQISVLLRTATLLRGPPAA